MSAALAVLPMVFAVAAERKELCGVPAPELAFYRKYTEGMLRRYLRLSMEAGRVPSLLGREMFRGHVTNYKVHGFDDVVIFVHDVEKCLKRLTETQQMLIERVALQEYTQGETAQLAGMSLRTVVRICGGGGCADFDLSRCGTSGADDGLSRGPGAEASMQESHSERFSGRIGRGVEPWLGLLF